MNKETLPVFDTAGNPVLINSFYKLDDTVYLLEKGRAIPDGVWLCHCGFNQNKDLTLAEIDGKLTPATEEEKAQWNKFYNGLMENFRKYGCD